jgi:hypothetical protein
MLVRMITTAAGPQGVFHAGTNVDVPEGLARAWVAGHCAVVVGGNDGRYTATVGSGKVETAMLAPAEPVVLPIEMRAPVKVVDPVLSFGKYKGETIGAIYAKDPGYVKNYLTKINDPEIAAAAKAIAG